jgi:hypothetical protein
MCSEMFFQHPHARFGVVKDRSREGRVGAPGGEHIDEMIEGAGAA